MGCDNILFLSTIIYIDYQGIKRLEGGQADLCYQTFKE